MEAETKIDAAERELLLAMVDSIEAKVNDYITHKEAECEHLRRELAMAEARIDELQKART